MRQRNGRGGGCSHNIFIDRARAQGGGGGGPQSYQKISVGVGEGSGSRRGSRGGGLFSWNFLLVSAEDLRGGGP